MNQLLVNMDGFDSKNKIIVMAATNLKDSLDPALLRPGRFDRAIEISLPNFEERAEILKGLPVFDIELGSIVSF